MKAEEYRKLSEGGDYGMMEDGMRRIIASKPTEIDPHDRELLLRSLLSDLEDKEAAPWTQWPPSLYLASLQAMKILGRNPVGSTPIVDGIRTILHHTSLPLPPPASPFSHPPNDPEHPTSLESLTIIANACVLHTAGGRILADAGGGLAVAKALRDVNISMQRLLLLARLGFLSTLARPTIVGNLVNKEGLVETLVRHLNSTPVIPANYAAIQDLLKYTNNVIHFYPTKSEEWSDELVPLLAPILAIFHSIPFDDLTPPLSNTIHTLLSIPFSKDLQPIWAHGRPVTPAPISSSAIDKLSSILMGQPRRSIDSVKDAMSLSPPGSNDSARRRSPSPTRLDDITAVPLRVLRILRVYCDHYLQLPAQPDDEENHRLDEHLAPILALLVQFAKGSQEVRSFVKEQVLPVSLDRSPEAGPLEKRSTILGYLLRLMNSVKHVQSQNTAGELIWVICGSDPATVSTEIGYGNAAGLLFRKGLSGPPPASIQELPDDTHAAQEERHPITSLAPPSIEPFNPLDGMTEEEKEREAEKLFVLFDRMEKNPVISMKSGDDDNEKPKTPTDIMREKLERGQLEDNGGEEETRDEQERKDEKEAMAELRRYKERTSRK